MSSRSSSVICYKRTLKNLFLFIILKFQRFNSNRSASFIYKKYSLKKHLFFKYFKLYQCIFNQSASNICHKRGYNYFFYFKQCQILFSVKRKSNFRCDTYLVLVVSPGRKRLVHSPVGCNVLHGAPGSRATDNGCGLMM